MKKEARDERAKHILDQLERFGLGDFSQTLPVSEGGDELNAIMESINRLGAKLKDSRKTEKEKEERVNGLLDVVLKFITLDFTLKARIGDAGDEVDALAAGMNALAQELQFHIDRLNENEEQIETIFNGAPDAVVVIDEQGKIKRWNPAAEKIFGWLHEDVVDKPLHEILIPDRYRERHLAGMKHFLKTGEGPVLNKTIELAALKKDGAEIEIELNISAAKPGEEYLFISFIRDITLRKKAEEKIRQLNASLEHRVVERTVELQESEKKYRNLFQHNPMPLWILEIPTLRFLDVNESAIQSYGYRHDEFLAMTAVDILGEENRDSFTRLNWREINRNRGVYRHIKKDGSSIFAEINFHGITYEGKPASLVLAVDVTEKYKAEEALRKSEALFRKVFDSRIIGLLFWDADGNVSNANDVFLETVGYTREDLMNGSVHWKDMTPPEYTELDIAAIQEIAARGVCNPFEKEYIRKDGTRVPVMLAAAALDDGKGENGVAYVMDISDRKKMEKEILALNRDLERRVRERTQRIQLINKELESFTYSVSHDLRAPLRAINGYANMLMEDYDAKLDEEGKRLITTIQNNAKKMGRLVDDLLEFSRLGKRELNAVTCNLDEIVKEVVHELYPENNGKAKMIIHPLGSACVDPALMRHVFQNLIGNAIKYSSKKNHPAVEIGKMKLDGRSVYYVKDNGAGFDMTYYSKLFGVFQRLHREEEFEGTGVGLAIVHRIVTRHGGKIWAEAKAEHGATFYFTLNEKNPK